MDWLHDNAPVRKCKVEVETCIPGKVADLFCKTYGDLPPEEQGSLDIPPWEPAPLPELPDKIDASAIRLMALLGLEWPIDLRTLEGSYAELKDAQENAFIACKKLVRNATLTEEDKALAPGSDNDLDGLPF
jgi:hypothetical protein